MTIDIIRADLSNAQHAQAMFELLDEYAHDVTGGGCGLSQFVKENLAATLQARQDTHVIFAVTDNCVVGLAICFEGFSTFACKPLLNIHDLMVTQRYRGLVPHHF
jgi:hypothetical protein